MKELLEQLEEMKKLSEKIYDSAGELRDLSDENLKQACNFIRHFQSRVNQIIDLGRDIVIYTERGDQMGLINTMGRLGVIDH